MSVYVVYMSVYVVCIYVKYCLFKVLMLQKIRKNKDASLTLRTFRKSKDNNIL